MKQTIRWTDKWNEISTRLHSHPQWNCKISASNNNQYNIGSAHTMATNVTTRSFRKQQKSPRPWTPRWPHWACGVCQAPGGDWCHQMADNVTDTGETDIIGQLHLVWHSPSLLTQSGSPRPRPVDPGPTNRQRGESREGWRDARPGWLRWMGRGRGVNNSLQT